MSTFQQKLDEARALLDQHNSQVPALTAASDLKAGRVDLDSFFSNLAQAGGTNEHTLAQCTWEDLQEFGLPKLLARQVATIFRKEAKKEEKPVLKKSKVEVMTVGELIAHYEPRNPASIVTDKLKHLLGNTRFLVFNDDGSVNVEVSTKLAQEILDEYPDREHYFANGESSKTYRIGERPDQSFDENPLYPGRILRPDGDCDQTNRSWNGVSLETKQIIYLAVAQTKEIVINSINDAHNIMDLVVGKSDNDVLKHTIRQRFSKAAAVLKEMYNQGRAPVLKIFKKVAENGKKNNPFGASRTY
jgi:hypothetical protein